MTVNNQEALTIPNKPRQKILQIFDKRRRASKNKSVGQTTVFKMSKIGSQGREVCPGVMTSANSFATANAKTSEIGTRDRIRRRNSRELMRNIERPAWTWSSASDAPR